MNRYLIQFRDYRQDHFTTDCAFREGQLYLALCYLLTIVDGLGYVAEGQVLDVKFQICVFRYPQE